MQADAGWASLVKPGNVVDMTASSFERFKTQLQPADVPEAILLQGEFKLKPFGASSRIAEMEQRFQLILTQRFASGLSGESFEISDARLRWRKSGSALGLDGLVRDWQITQGEDDALGQKQWRRGSQRWVSVLAIRVNMFVTRERLTSLS